MSLVNSERYGCSRSRNKGTCSNRETVNRNELETAILTKIKADILNDHFIAIFVHEYNRRQKELNTATKSNTDNYKAQAIKLERQKDNLIASIREGVPADILRDELIKIDSELNRALLLANSKPEADVIDFNIAANYKSFVRGLTPENLGDEDKNKVRDLIACVKPLPLSGNVLAEVNIDLEGFISPDTKRPAYGVRGESSMMVAGEGFMNSLRIIRISDT